MKLAEQCKNLADKKEFLNIEEKFYEIAEMATNAARHGEHSLLRVVNVLWKDMLPTLANMFEMDGFKVSYANGACPGDEKPNYWIKLEW
jgi:hypothetical protein